MLILFQTQNSTSTSAPDLLGGLLTTPVQPPEQSNGVSPTSSNGGKSTGFYFSFYHLFQ